MACKVTSVVACLFLVICFSYIPSNASAQDDDELLEVTDMVWMNFTLGGFDIGQVVFGVFGKIAPLSVENFLAFVNHTYGYGYRGANCHRVIAWFMAQCGDMNYGRGNGFDSIYRDYCIRWGWCEWPDENFDILHYGGGQLGWVNRGVNRTGHQFYVTTERADWLDYVHVLFGGVLSGMSVIYEIEFTPKVWDDCWQDKPEKRVAIKDTGIIDMTGMKPFGVKREGIIGNADGLRTFDLPEPIDPVLENERDELESDIEERKQELLTKINEIDAKIAALEEKLGVEDDGETGDPQSPAPSDDRDIPTPASAPGTQD